MPDLPGLPSRLITLPWSFFATETVTVARALLGKFLVHRTTGVERVGRIVETEAYLGTHDLAAHSSHGKTKRNASMFGPIGHAYVYMIYGMYECMNIVTESEGKGAAVLIRALEPVRGIDGRTSGPGLLTRAMGITRVLDGCDLLSDDFHVAHDPDAGAFRVATASRIGVGYAGRWSARLLRFYVRDNPFVSRR